MRNRLASGRWRAGLAAGAAVVWLAGATPASAHLRSGTVAVDYRASVTNPRTQAYTAAIYQSDHGLSLTLHPGHAVMVLGYLGEPVMRLDASGLSVNAASPTARAMHLVDAAHAVSAAAPRWRLQRERHVVVWHDARVQGLPSGLVEGVWRVPLVIDGRNGVLSGRLRRFPDPPLWLWLGAFACWLAAGTLPLARGRRDQARSWAIVLALIGAAAATVVAVAFALDAYASPGTWIVGVDVVIFLAVGVEVLRRGPRHLHVAAAIWLGFVSVALGLLSGAVFLHPIVLAVLPGPIMRLLVLTALGAGAGAAILGATRVVEITADATPPAADSVSM
jgi:hypothetical protein